jgi:putative ABC transport system permease protein
MTHEVGQERLDPDITTYEPENMLVNYVRLAFRKLLRQKSFSALNIAGLSLGTVSCIVIMMFVAWERSYDEFRSPDIYRVAYHGFQNNVETEKSAQYVPAFAPAIKQDIPEVIDAVRLAHTGPFMADPVIQYGDKNFRENRIYFADPSFLTMFSYRMLTGSNEHALRQPSQVALSSSMAKKYFGAEEPLGKTITFHQGERGASELIVTGVFEDVPANAHFHTDFVISFSTLPFKLDTDWGWGNFYTYIKLAPGTAPSAVEGKIPALLHKYMGEYLDAEAKAGNRIQLSLQPIQAIHLDSRLWGEMEANGDRNTVNFLSIIAVFILLIAWVNYINFAIARSTENQKEISIRKISGSDRFQLMVQVIMESAVINLCSMIVSIGVIQAVLPLLKTFVELPEGLTFTTNHLMAVGALFIVCTLCSGLYPAYFISTLKPVLLLKTKVSRSAFSMNMNRVLIVFQFTASIVLIIGTVTIYRQLNFMRTQDTGLALDETLIVKGPAVKDSTYSSHLDFFYNAIDKLPGISAMAVSSSIPGQELHWGRPLHRSEDATNSIDATIVAVDERFFSLFNATFVAGNNFSDATTLNKDAIILNETAAKLLNDAKPADIVGQTIMWGENSGPQPKRVVGVVKDFHQQSLRKEVGPIVFTLKKYVYAPWAGEFYSFKIPAKNAAASIASIQQVWKEVYPANPFDYFFLNDFFNAQYKNDEQFGKIFSAFSTLAILIACLGLFGLTSYMTALRTKEIGIRKVLGSSALNLVQLLSKNFIILVLISFMLACPLAAYGMNQWLEQFAYRIPLSAWIFIVSGLLCLTVAILTVGLKSWKAANINPAQALQYE